MGIALDFGLRQDSGTFNWIFNWFLAKFVSIRGFSTAGFRLILLLALSGFPCDSSVFHAVCWKYVRVVYAMRSEVRVTLDDVARNLSVSRNTICSWIDIGVFLGAQGWPVVVVQGTGIRRALVAVPELQLESDHDSKQFTVRNSKKGGVKCLPYGTARWGNDGQDHNYKR